MTSPQVWCQFGKNTVFLEKGLIQAAIHIIFFKKEQKSIIKDVEKMYIDGHFFDV